MKQLEIKTQKEKLVIKRLIGLLLFVLFIASCSPRMQGIYCSERDLLFDCYKLNKNGAFSYSKGSDLGVDLYAAGEYRIEDNNFILDNRDTKPLGKYSTYSLRRYAPLADSIQVDIHVIDKVDNEPFARVGILSGDFDWPEDEIGETDFGGKFTVYLPKMDTTYRLEAGYLGYWPAEVEFYGMSSYGIRVLMAEGGSGYPVETKMDTFPLLARTRHSFTIKDRDGEVKEYKKLRKRR